ncbi:MAG: pimeloyl-ACP methyl ester carboxylesterase [Polyangiales bacterium]|jgi:pimeloyl-ACP methyl ester carboxylesterase
MRTWRGVKALLHDAVDATLELVREGHESSSRAVRSVTDEIEPLAAPVQAIDGLRRFSTSGVLGTIKLANRSIQSLSDFGLSRVFPSPGRSSSTVAASPTAVPLRSSIMGTKSWLGDATLGLLNAAVGDHLYRTGSELDLSMVVRLGDEYVPAERGALEEALRAVEVTDKVAVFVHGLGTTEWSWCLEAEAYYGDDSATFASMLARDLGFTPMFIRYNTGRHVSENGRGFAALLDELALAYPMPIQDLSVFGHSMGGLVASSACLHAEEHDMAWTKLLRRVFYFGSPHQGAPLARVGHALTETLGQVDLPATQIIARILERRSAGVHDLYNGAIVDEEWLTHHPLARDTLPLAHAAHYFVSASVTEDPAHPLGQIIGDLLVRVSSASGPKMSEHAFPIDTRHYGGVMHHHLQNHPAVYEQVRAACET